MLTTEQKWSVLAVCLLTLIAMAVVAVYGIREPVSFQFDRVQPAFDAEAALSYTKTLAENYPDRVTGSPAGARAAKYIGSELQRLGYSVSVSLFNMWLRGKRVEGQNVIGEIPGDTGQTVAIIAHYDSQFTSHQAAEDNASGVGVLMELGRVLASKKRHRGLILVATDGEEWGMIGTRDLRGFFRNRKTVAVISIDYLTAGPARALAMDCEGQVSGYTPLWFREVVRQSANRQKVPLESASGLWEWIERSIELSSQDQGPLLRAGIPALNLSTVPLDEAGARARYHTPEDVFGNFQSATFRMVGDTVEQTASALDTLEDLSPREMKYLLLSKGRWIDRSALEWLQMLGLIPFMVACVLAVMNFEDDGLTHPLWSYLRPALYLFPLLLALVSLHGMTSGGVLARYEFYPATPKDPFLYRIPLRVAAPLAAVLVLGYLAVRMLRLFLPPAPQSFDANKRIACVWIYVIVVGALYVDPYAMWLFLGPLAYCFLLLQRPSTWSRRVVNALLLLAGALPFLAVVYIFGHQIFLGWRIVWYLVLQTAYGVWSRTATVLFLMALALWVQLFRLAVLRRDPEELPA
jgi:alkaline phosphatase isozyme conversion protein